MNVNFPNYHDTYLRSITSTTPTDNESVGSKTQVEIFRQMEALRAENEQLRKKTEHFTEELFDMQLRVMTAEAESQNAIKKEEKKFKSEMGFRVNTQILRTICKLFY